AADAGIGEGRARGGIKLRRVGSRRPDAARQRAFQVGRGRYEDRRERMAELGGKLAESGDFRRSTGVVDALDHGFEPWLGTHRDGRLDLAGERRSVVAAPG